MGSKNDYARTATCRFTPTTWTEEVLADIDDPGRTEQGPYYPDRGITRVLSRYRYTGAVDGTSSVAYLICYLPGEAAPVTGFEHFEGCVDGHKGSFVLRHTGAQDAGSVRAHLEVVAGMGSGDLAALRGEAELVIDGHRDDGYALVLYYDLS